MDMDNGMLLCSLIARCVDANRKSCGLLFFFSWDQRWGRSTSEQTAVAFAVWEWPALGLPLSITCARGEEDEEGQRLFRELLLEGTCAIGEE